jgi:hypothetical protein
MHNAMNEMLLIVDLLFEQKTLKEIEKNEWKKDGVCKEASDCQKKIKF